jgi:hypothetical protein
MTGATVTQAKGQPLAVRRFYTAVLDKKLGD